MAHHFYFFNQFFIWHSLDAGLVDIVVGCIINNQVTEALLVLAKLLAQVRDLLVVTFRSFLQF